MATSSPAPFNNSNITGPSPTPTPTNIAFTTTKNNSPSKSYLMPQRDPPKSMRGLNKPKCSQCGNVARSRCPFVSCKSCCAEAQNPCHIHVLKQNGTSADKPQASTTSLFDQKSTDLSPPGASSVSSIRQLSELKNSQLPFPTRRSLTRKDAAALNQWRFSKLNEYKQRNNEAENEAFDHYMHNVNLLEETFLVNCSPEGPIADDMSALDSTSTNKEENTGRMLLEFKAQLRRNPGRAANFKRRIQDIVDHGLRKWDLDHNKETADANDLDGLKEAKRLTKSLCVERASALDELVDKLNKARNEEDLQSCGEMKSLLFHRHEKPCTNEKIVVETSTEQTSRHESYYLPTRLRSAVEIDQETLHTIDMHFSSLDQIEDL